MNRGNYKKRKNYRKNKSDKYIIVLLVLIIIGIFVFIGVKLGWFNNGVSDNNLADVSNNIKNSVEINNNNTNENVLLNNIDSNTENEQNSEDDEKSEKVYELSDKAILDILLEMNTFESAEELSNDKYLAIVYNALNKDYIDEFKSRHDDSKKTAVYTAKEINSVLYSILGVNLKENKSYGDLLKYKDGKYTLKFTNSDSSNLVAKNIENDVAAGTLYIEYDLYSKENGNEKLKGHYAIGKSNVTGFVRNKKKM